MSTINSVHLTGNLTAAPELRFLDSGIALATFGLAVNKRVRNEQTGKWEDGAPLFIRVTAFRELAENVAESLSKGTYATVNGELRQHTYTTDAGEKRTTFEVVADEVTVNLRFATAKVTRAVRTIQGAAASDNGNQRTNSAPAASNGAAAWTA